MVSDILNKHEYPLLWHGPHYAAQQFQATKTPTNSSITGGDYISLTLGNGPTGKQSSPTAPLTPSFSSLCLLYFSKLFTFFSILDIILPIFKGGVVL